MVFVIGSVREPSPNEGCSLRDDGLSLHSPSYNVVDLLKSLFGFPRVTTPEPQTRHGRVGDNPLH